MTGVQIIGALLFAHAPLIARVPKRLIKVEEVPQGSELEFIVIEHVSGLDWRPLNPGVKRRVNDFVRVTAAAASIAAREELLELIDQACGFKLGAIAGATGVSVQRDGDGPPITVNPSKIYTRAKDYRVSFSRSA